MNNKITIIFDGGTSCNSPKKGFGEGYGSFKVGDHPIQRVKFGKGHSNNSAEIRTLVEAIKYAKLHFPNCFYRIIGDSKIALSWVWKSGPPKPYKGKLPTLNFFEAVKLLQEVTEDCYKCMKTEWWPRKNSVALFGH